MSQQKIELPEKIKYMLQMAGDKTNSIQARKNYIDHLKDIRDELDKSIRFFDNEILFGNSKKR